jgi:hypothetical protein
VFSSVKVTGLEYTSACGVKHTISTQLTDPERFPIDATRLFSGKLESSSINVYVDLTMLDDCSLHRLVGNLLQLRLYSPLAKQLAKPELNGTL